MSINVDWEALTGGPDGEQLAQTILDFINDRFQKVALPKFIRSVKAHSFEFGSIPPTLELKDVCDPLGDFYETDDDEEENDEGEASAHRDFQKDGKEFDRQHPETISANHLDAAAAGGVAPNVASSLTDTGSVASASVQDLTLESLKYLDEANRHAAAAAASRDASQHRNEKETMQPPPLPPPKLRTHNLPNTAHSHSHSRWSPIDLPSAAGMLSRASTPGIPGGTSNLSYFHSPLSGGLPTSASGVFASMAGGQFANNLMDHRQQHGPYGHGEGEAHGTGSSGRAPLDPGEASKPAPAPIPSEPGTLSREKGVNDVQIVAHVRYSGDIKLSLTADILLDYPMPSFVGIPLKLNVTGMTFDGVAIIAYIKRKAHFCFLSPEDAEALVGRDTSLHVEKGGDPDDYEEEHPAAPPEDEEEEETQEDHILRRRTTHSMKSSSSAHHPIGGLLEEIKVESEIGQKEPGKQVLKNVGKVERFVLEQVRRIFENEFVYPSFWTFLV